MKYIILTLMLIAVVCGAEYYYLGTLDNLNPVVDGDGYAVLTESAAVSDVWFSYILTENAANSNLMTLGAYPDYPALVYPGTQSVANARALIEDDGTYTWAHFDGNDDYISQNDLLPEFSNDTVQAIEFWAKTDTDDGANHVAWSIVNTADGNNRTMYVNMEHASDRIQFVLWVGSTFSWQYVGANNSLDANTWYHIVMTRNQSNSGPAFYTNGVNVTGGLTLAAGTRTNDWSSYLWTFTSDPTYTGLGAWGDGGLTLFYDGYIDASRTHGTAQGDSDVLSLFNNSKSRYGL